MKKFIVELKPEYIRDTQVYHGMPTSEDQYMENYLGEDEENADNGWYDYNGYFGVILGVIVLDKDISDVALNLAIAKFAKDNNFDATQLNVYCLDNNYLK